MKDKRVIVPGVWLVFNDTGGRCTGDLKVGEPLQIISLDKPYQSKGDCNAVLSSGARVRLSTIDSYEPENRYGKYFEVVLAPYKQFLIYN